MILLIESEPEELNSQKSSTDIRVVCSIEGIPPGYIVEEYFNNGSCPNYNLFLGRFNAAIVSKDGTPKISRAGAGCNDNYCIWIVGSNFENGCYEGQQVITFRLRSAYERQLFAQSGLRIWVVNPEARKWADGRTVRRPRDIIIDPPCDPICP